MSIINRVLFSLPTLVVVCLAATDLKDIRSVYTWPMAKSFDQYLAEQITAENVFDVVVDPQLADVILTDRIDAPFLAVMNDLFPLSAGKNQKAPITAKQDKSDSIESGGTIKRPINRVLGRPQGTLFLVHIETRKVLWSTYLREHEATPNKLHQMASGVVKRLKKALGFTP